MAKYLRCLRILWTVFCGTACLLLCVMWVRSYCWTDALYGPASRTRIRVVASDSGSICSFAIPIATFPINLPNQGIITTSRYLSFRSSLEQCVLYNGYLKQDAFIDIPHWQLCFVSATLATVPWIRWRFSVRILLIAITLLSLVLGLIVYLAGH
jgi:hypothetical protein